MLVGITYQKKKKSFEKDFLKLMNNSVFEKTIENVKERRDIKLVTIERRRSYLVSEPNYHTTKFVTENLLTFKIRDTQTPMNKSVYLGSLPLDLFVSK